MLQDLSHLRSVHRKLKRNFFIRSKDITMFRDSGVDFVVTSRTAGNMNITREPHMTHNISRIASILHIEDLSYFKQVHGDDIVEFPPTSGVEADGVIITQRNKWAMIVLADCAGVLIYASRPEALALLHVGRKGAESGLITKALQKLRAMGCKEFTAFVTPHIKFRHYEMHKSEYMLKFPRIRHVKNRCKRKQKIRYFFDLERLIRSQLHGIRTYVSRRSTFNTRRLYSHRYEWLKNRSAGRFAIIASLKSTC